MRFFREKKSLSSKILELKIFWERRNCSEKKYTKKFLSSKILELKRICGK